MPNKIIHTFIFRTFIFLRMKLEEYGYNPELENHWKELSQEGFEIGRIVSEHKERYVVRTEGGEMEAEITGHLRFTAKGREDFPAVGDWVAILSYDSDLAIIHKILPRYSVISRQAVGQFGEVQIIGTNIDVALLVQAVDRDFNINRLERYLTICYASRVEPAILLTKTDLIDAAGLADIHSAIQQRIPGIPVFSLSNETMEGYESIRAFIQKGKTYCLLGSSGVGKSSLLNNLSGKKRMKTDAISQNTGKGRHITSHRELILLEDGGILIDNPGMREVGITDLGQGLETAFDRIVRLAAHCRFRDCTHTNETGCAVLDAMENGGIDRHAYENYQKMEREKAHFESSIAERRKRDKEFGKMVKNIKKDYKK